MVAATYGGNRPGMISGNQTAALADECDGTVQDCEYYVNTAALPDPAPGCAKNYIAEWNCGKDPATRRAD